jgi:hypothetical protein
MGPVGRWFVFTVIAGLVPYGAVVYVSERVTHEWAFPPSSELLFLSLIVFASALGEVLASMEEHRRSPAFRPYYLVGMLAGLALAAFMYGTYVRDAVASPGRLAGVDCAALMEVRPTSPTDTTRPAQWREADSVRTVLARRWGRECREWYEGQRTTFRQSRWLLGWATALGLIGMLTYGPPMRRTRMRP